MNASSVEFSKNSYTLSELVPIFKFYEVFGIITNPTGGWIGVRISLPRTMQAGLFLHVFALQRLSVFCSWLTTLLVITAQAILGIAEGLSDMSGKSSAKSLVRSVVKVCKAIAFLTSS